MINITSQYPFSNRKRVTTILSDNIDDIEAMVMRESNTGRRVLTVKPSPVSFPSYYGLPEQDNNKQ